MATSKLSLLTISTLLTIDQFFALRQEVEIWE
jgi:hypothetical protein